MSKRVMLSGYYGFENFGDELILEVILQHLQQWDLSPVVLSGTPEETTRRFGVESLMRTEIPQIWQSLGQMKALISGGGGLFQDVTGPGSPLYYGGLIQMARWRKVPVAFFAQGVGPLKTSIGRYLTGRAIRQASLLSVRDIKSSVLVSKISGREPTVVADPVWTWEPDETVGQACQNRQGLGVSLRPWPSLDDRAIQHLARCIADLPTIREVGVNLIDCHAGSDIVPLAKLEQALKAYQIPMRWFTQANCLTGIAQSTAVLAMRYHAAVIAVQLGLPVLTLSYDPKVQFMAAHLKLPDCPVEILDTLSAQRIRETLALADESALETLRKNARRGFEQLHTWLRGV